MKTELKKENLKVTVELNAKNFNQYGELLNAIEASAKLTKADAGRISIGDEDSLNINASTCDIPTIEANYTGQRIGKGESETALELNLKGKVFNDETQELVDVIAADAKLKKLDDGKDEAQATKDWFRLKAVKNTNSECASIESNYNTRNISI